MVHHSRKAAERVTLEYLMYASSDREASEPRDHVYALLGLVDDPLFDEFEPDYSQPASWAYQKAMVSIFKSRKDLTFLLCKLRQKATAVLSWCVDFSKKWELNHINDINLSENYGIMESGATTGRRTFDIRHDIQRGTITLTGTVVGKIVTTRVLFPRALINPESLFRAFISNEEWFNSSDAELPPAMKTLLDGMHEFTRISQKAWEKRLGRKAACMKVESGDVWRTAGFYSGFKSRGDRLTVDFAVAAKLASTEFLTRRTMTSDVIFKTAWSTYKVFMNTLLHGVCLFSTDTNYVGSGVEDVQSGDLLCILFGCKLPLILRPGNDGMYKLVSSAFADGIMNGEFLEEGVGYTEVDFVLN